MHLLAFVDHVVSDIITPALDPRFNIERLTLLCHRTHLDLAFDVAGVCHKLHLATDIENLPPDSQPLALHQRLQELVHARACFNISAASPVQAALAYSLALEHHLAVMVVEHEHDRLIWLRGGESSHLHSGSEIADGLSLEAYFALYGSRVQNIHYRLNRRNPLHERLARDLAEHAAVRPRALSLLNRLCNEIDEQQFSLHPLSSGEHVLRDWLDVNGMVEFRDSGHMRCIDPRVRFFLAGGWLEVWLLSQVAELAQTLPISDAAVGVKISHRSVENEYDVAILCNNHLFLIECKTTAPTGLMQRGVGLENLFKLNSVAALGGLGAKAMLASLYVPTDSECSRAEAQSIALLSGPDLRYAREYLREWLVS